MAACESKSTSSKSIRVNLIGYLSITIPMGITKKAIRENVAKYIRLKSVEVQLYGSSRSGAYKACGVSSPYAYPAMIPTANRSNR